MKFFNNLNDIQKSFLIITLFIIGISSINTGIINIGSLSFIVISFLLILFYFSSYILINLISYSAIQISSVIVLFCVKVTIYSSIPVPIYLLFLLLIFLLTITILRNQFRWIIFSTLSILMISYYFFNEENIRISDSLDLFEHKKGGADSNYFTYSTGEDKYRDEYKNPDFLSYSIDASEIMEDDWNQSKINWREVFWGFNKENIPLNGRLWIPDGNEKYPIVSIIHGNHSMQEFSDNGYNYLGEFLSSHGYIFNSVDQNFLNGSWEGDFKGKEMTTRSWHFLENLSYLKELSSDSLSPLYNKVDFNKIIFIGHSRGGEAVNLAAKFNNLSTYPDNGNVKFNYDFNIIGIVTLAPTDYRYSRNYELKNMNYLSLQGSMDSDEESFFGMRQSNRITNSIDTLVNTNILIEGANHSQFNTSWGNSDSGFPSKYLINYRNIIPDWLQRKILNEEVLLKGTLEGGVLNYGDSRVTDRFFLGSALMRGFEPGGIGPREIVGEGEIINDALGGNTFAVLRLEAEFSLGLPEEYGVDGGIFFDVGNLWSLDKINENVIYEDGSWRSVVGASLFWKTPIGPLRFNFSRPLQKETFDREQNFDLTIRTQF